MKKSLSVEIEADEVDRKLERAYQKLGKQAKVKGFRPGKVPRRILERHYGDQVLDDVVRDLINDSFPAALQEADVFPLGAPLLEKETLKPGQTFRYSAVMEVRPRFELPEYLGIGIEKEPVEVTEEMLRQQLDQIRKSHGQLNPLEPERPVRNGDYVLLDYEAFHEGRPVEGVKADNFLLSVGDAELHPELEKALVGHSKGDEPEIRILFDAAYRVSQLAGKDVLFKVRIQDVKQMVLPEPDDAFAQSLGGDFKDYADLESKVREGMIRDAQRRADRRLRQRLVEKIAEKLQIELPEVLVAAEVSQMVGNLRQSLARSGSSLEKSGLSEEKLASDFRPAAEKRVKEMLLLGEIAGKEQITLKEEELTAGFQDLGTATGQDPETIRRYYEARDMVDALRERLLEQKTLNYLAEHATVTEGPGNVAPAKQARTDKD